MKQTLAILTLGFAMLWLCSCATSTAPAPAPSTDEKSAAAENVEQTLMQMERDWMDAFVKQDAAALGRILADDWAGISWDGRLSDKAKSIAEMPLGTTGSVTMDPMKVRVFGDVAIVTGGDTEKGTYKGKDTSGHYLWTDVFVKRNGQWQAVASQNTKAPPAKP
jgi:ketosteroid isomerase-like protein